VVGGEEKSLAALVQHVAWSLDAESQVFVELAKGSGESGWTAEWLDEHNRRQALFHAYDSKEEAMASLRDAAQCAVRRVAAMTDAELARTGQHMPGEPKQSVARWVEVCLIAHPMDHLAAVENFAATTRSGSP
jgi:hypothetical protein